VPGAKNVANVSPAKSFPKSIIIPTTPEEADIVLGKMLYNERKLELIVKLKEFPCLWETNSLAYRLNNIDLGKPKSVASVFYLDIVNNYTVIQHVKQILDDFVVSAVLRRKCAKSQVLFMPTASQSFFRP